MVDEVPVFATTTVGAGARVAPAATVDAPLSARAVLTDVMVATAAL